MEITKVSAEKMSSSNSQRNSEKPKATKAIIVTKNKTTELRKSLGIFGIQDLRANKINAEPSCFSKIEGCIENDGKFV